MSKNQRNCKTFHCPDGYELLIDVDPKRKEERTRPLVYICSPYSGDVEQNAFNACVYSRFAALRGYIPITPHLLFTQFLDDEKPAERELGLQFGNALMDECAEVWVFGSHVSRGMKAEIERAKRLHYKIRYFTEELRERKEVPV